MQPFQPPTSDADLALQLARFVTDALNPQKPSFWTAVLFALGYLNRRFNLLPRLIKFMTIQEAEQRVATTPIAVVSNGNGTSQALLLAMGSESKRLDMIAAMVEAIQDDFTTIKDAVGREAGLATRLNTHIDEFARFKTATDKRFDIQDGHLKDILEKLTIMQEELNKRA